MGKFTVAKLIGYIVKVVDMYREGKITAEAAVSLLRDLLS